MFLNNMKCHSINDQEADDPISMTQASSRNQQEEYHNLMPRLPKEAHVNSLPYSVKTKRYPCDYCQKSFSKPSALRTHKYTHTGERPFACHFPGCQSRFAVSSNLRRHFKVHSTKSSPRRPSQQERLEYVNRLAEMIQSSPRAIAPAPASYAVAQASPVPEEEPDAAISHGISLTFAERSKNGLKAQMCLSFDSDLYLREDFSIQQQECDALSAVNRCPAYRPTITDAQLSLLSSESMSLCNNYQSLAIPSGNGPKYYYYPQGDIQEGFQDTFAQMLSPYQGLCPLSNQYIF